MNGVRPILFIALLASLVIWLSCSERPVASGGTDTETGGTVAGVITTSDGGPAAHTAVILLPSGYNPVIQGRLPDSMTDTTGADGVYSIRVRAKGAFNIQAVNLVSRSRLLLCGITYSGADVRVQTAVLSRPGSLRMTLPESIDRANGFIFIPGTTIALPLDTTGATIVLDSVPSGTLPDIMYCNTISSQQKIIRSSMKVTSEATAAIAYPFWACARNIRLNTAPAGANVMGNVTGFPVLLRLTANNFKFAEAQHGGNDVRFARHDSIPVPYEIERWDSVNQHAELWVRLDTVYGNDSLQYMTMYWGNPIAAGSSNSAAVFDTANGFQGVWHLSGEGNTLAYDATGNHYDGTPYNMTAASALAGAIGEARQFDGATSSITMSNTAGGKLDFIENGAYSMSLWVYADTIDTLWHDIAGKGHEQYYMQYKCFGKNRATWEFVEFHEQKGWEYTEDSTPPAPGPKQWLYMVGVRSGTSQRLYINGELAVDTTALMPGSYARNTGDNFSIGRYVRSVTIPYYQGWSSFKGRVDEVRVSSVVPTADWIKLCYMNQKAGDALVVFDQD